MHYRKIYESFYGKIPKDSNGRSYDIHHIDGNRENNSIENLVALSIEEHYALHLEQKDYGACLLIARRMDVLPEDISTISKLTQKNRIAKGNHNIANASVEERKEWNSKRVLNGTHNFLKQNRKPDVQYGLDSSASKKLSLERLEKGTHNLIGLSKKRVEDGTHNFLKENRQEISPETRKKRSSIVKSKIAEGTHNFSGKNFPNTPEKMEIKYGSMTEEEWQKWYDSKSDFCQNGSPNKNKIRAKNARERFLNDIKC